MSRRSVVFLRVLQVMLAIANLVLAAYVYNWYANIAHKPSPGSLQFLVFAPCASLVSVVYLEIARRQTTMVFAHLLASLGVEGFNSILYFGGFIAFALSLSEFTACEGVICTLSRAVAVLAASEFSVWIATTIMAAQTWFQSEDVPAKNMAGDQPMGQV
ncbi:hypothetical protein K4F52_010183 [Lecanicillium sp. MT-2017a]|nr:hypothetical protein K4F52_010183 [Lecanicillium sp. MT-2017a]